MAYLIGLHQLSAVIWVGGMFVAYFAVRPASASLDPSSRFLLWKNIGSKFFPIVGIACIALVGTGYAIIFEYSGGFSNAGIHVHIMQLTGWLMIGLFGHLIAVPYRKLCKSVNKGNNEESAIAIAGMRRIIAINLILGVATVLI